MTVIMISNPCVMEYNSVTGKGTFSDKISI